MAGAPLLDDRWSTACSSDGAATSPLELSALSEHLSQCSLRSARLSALRGGAQQWLGFCSARLVSSVLIACLLLVAACWR